MAKRRTLYIKNPVAHRLAEQISKRTGVTLTQAVIQALESEARKAQQPVDRRSVDAISRRITALPILDRRSEDEILGYNQFGVPE